MLFEDHCRAMENLYIITRGRDWQGKFNELIISFNNLNAPSDMMVIINDNRAVADGVQLCHSPVLILCAKMIRQS